VRGRDGPPDKRLFRRARQGDRQAFLLLLRRYDPRLRRLVLRLVAEPERVDPILRRAYVKAWRSLTVVELPGSVAEWFYRVVYNTCVNELRWAPQRPPPEAVRGPRVPLPVASAERRLAGLRALTPEERIPLALVDGEGFNLEATARILQRPPVAVAADLSRARGRWRSFVMGDGVAAGAPEAVELEPDAAAVEAQAEADDIGPADPEAVAPDAQPRHVRVVVSAEGNGQTPTSPLETTQDAFGNEPSEPDAEPPAQTTSKATRPPRSATTKPDANPATPTGKPDAGPGTAPAGDASSAESAAEADAAPTGNPKAGTGNRSRRSRKGSEKNGSAPSPSRQEAKATPSTPADGEPSDGEPAPPATDTSTGPPSGNGEGTSSPDTRRAAETSASGAGARRKRRRDAKRDVRNRARSATSKPASSEPSKPESDADDVPRRGESHETS
jgi:RNA polymerase sigma-70 factor, ECF subfamily